MVVEDGDLGSAGSIPPSSQDAFANLFSRLGPLCGVNYSLADDLYHLVKRVGFSDPKLEVHQPALLEGEDRYFLRRSVAEAGPAFIHAGLLTSHQLERTLSEMQDTIEDRDVLILAPRMFLVWADILEIVNSCRRQDLVRDEIRQLYITFMVALRDEQTRQPHARFRESVVRFNDPRVIFLRFTN